VSLVILPVGAGILSCIGHAVLRITLQASLRVCAEIYMRKLCMWDGLYGVHGAMSMILIQPTQAVHYPGGYCVNFRWGIAGSHMTTNLTGCACAP